MMKVKLMRLIGVCSLISTVGNAIDCSNVVTQMDMNDCAALEFKKADAALNAAYNTLRKMRNEDEKKQLKEAQMAWIKYRDLDCKQVGLRYQGGSLYPLVINECQMEKTKIRTRELNEQKKI